jgi:gliding motility-associated-like protein
MPVAGFSTNDPSQCLSGNNFVFTNNSNIPSGSIYYIWQFGDATMSTLTNPSHTYLVENTYTVKLIVTSNFNCMDSVSDQLNVYPMPIPSFTVNDFGQCFQSNNFAFQNGSTISSGTMNYLWDFGDNSTSQLLNPAHSYMNFDTFQVKLLVTSNNSCADSTMANIYVYPEPVCGFSINDSNQCLKGNRFVFSNSSSVPNGSLKYLWNFGDNKSSTQAAPVHPYLTEKLYYVKLIVSTDNDCKDSADAFVEVYPMPMPSYMVNDNTQCLENNNCIFTNTTTISSGSLTIRWNFGDNTTSTLPNPLHSYNSHDTFPVMLIATSDYSCTDTAVSNVIIYPMPVAAFTINDSDQCLKGNNFVFSNTSTVAYGPLYNTWQFGDITSSLQYNPSHSYKSYSSYQIKLRVVSNNQCTDSTDGNIIVYPMPKANFTINDSTQCLKGNEFIFTNYSNIPVGNTHSFWQFGDFNTSTDRNPTHNYTYHKTFPVILTEISDFQCYDSMIKNVTVYPMPQVAFSVNDTTQCLKDNYFQFLNNSTISTGSLNYFWNFGDDYSSVTAHPAHKYMDDTFYLVSLIVSSVNQCIDSASQYVYVYLDPEVSLGSDTVVCPGDKIELDPGIYYSYLWQDGSTNQTFITTEPGNFKVIVTDENGCKATDNLSITPKCDLSLWVPSAFTPDGDGINDDLEIVALNWKEYQLKIFDRWGTLVYYTTDYYARWDGTFNGGLCQMDAYYVQVYVKYKSGEKKQAHQFVYVLR